MKNVIKMVMAVMFVLAAAYVVIVGLAPAYASYLHDVAWKGTIYAASHSNGLGILTAVAAVSGDLISASYFVGDVVVDIRKWFKARKEVTKREAA